LKVQVKELPEKTESNICYIPKDIFSELKLSSDIQYKFHLGQFHEHSFVIPCESNDECIYFTNSLMKKLLPYEDIILNIWKKEKDIYLGPVVGVFVNPKIIAAIKKGKPAFSTRKHAEAGNKTNCLSYYFSFDEIDWNKKLIKGYTYVQGLNLWKHEWLPIPNIIYDRVINIKKEDLPSVKYAKKELKKISNLHFINSKKYLNKWKVNKCLSKYSEMNSYLPETIIYRNFDDVLSMLKKYNFIFIKASGGTHGKQVISIEHVDKNYKLNLFEGRLKEITLKNIEDVKNIVEEFTKGRQFVVQQGIRLIKYNGHVMDIRLLMIKDEQGNWEAIQCHSRIAKDNYTITNYSLGGDWIEYEKVYPNLDRTYCSKNIPDKSELVNATKKVLYYIEKELGSFGEIGMDMAIDIYGNIWFIEANSRPEKLSDEKLHDPALVPSEALNIFKYAKFLAKQ
jgi:hypothetical protein